MIDSRAELDTSVEVGPGAVIGPNVRVGAHTVIGPYAVIESNTTIGARNHIFQFASIGAPHRARPRRRRITTAGGRARSFIHHDKVTPGRSDGTPR